MEREQLRKLRERLEAGAKEEKRLEAEIESRAKRSENSKAEIERQVKVEVAKALRDQRLVELSRQQNDLAEEKKQADALEEEIAGMEDALKQKRQKLTSVYKKIKLREASIAALSKDACIEE